MSDVIVKVDVSGLIKTEKQLAKGAKLTLANITERGRQILPEEMPEETGQLKNTGVKAAIYDFDNLTAVIPISAVRNSVGSRSATLHLPSGKTKQVTLRAQKAYDYARVVAQGNPAMKPKHAKVFLIPVASANIANSYITDGGNTYILRPEVKELKPNPYDARSAKRLQGEAPGIAEKVFNKLTG